MKLFRQQQRGDWKGVFARMAADLEGHPRLESAERYAERGMARLNEGKAAEAAALLTRALELDPKNAVLHNNRAVALDRPETRAEALAGFQEAARLKPDYVDALGNVGNVLRRMGRHTEAETEYRKALKLTPDVPDLLNNLGITLLAQAKHGEAEGCFRRCLRLKPDFAEAHNNLGVLLEQVGKVDEALACYLESVRLKPESVDPHKNLALGWLMRGNFARGCPEYEWRFKSPALKPRNFTQPRWDGRPLEGKSILLWHEQGLGDTIQFVRYAQLVPERGGRVLVECPAALEKLLRRCPAIDCVIPQGAPLPDFAYQIPFLSLPGVFGTTLETVPAAAPYLSAEPERIEEWRRELATIVGHVANVPNQNGHVENVPHPQPIKIGIAWQGSRNYQGDAHRSIALRHFAPLARIPGVRLISLQKGYGTEQLSAIDFDIVDFGAKLDADGAFLDTAAILTQLDLVITSDTAIVHLAGALGVPVWMAVSMAADWRWLRGREDSPWYPQMRLFRQTVWGDWPDVFARIAEALHQEWFGLAAPIMVEIAPGELLDKITILEIKRDRVDDAAKLQNIHVELGGLAAAYGRCVKPSAELARLTAQLKTENEELWEIEDAKRECERRQDFGPRFIELARGVYLRNDERARIKQRINQLLGTRIAEEKSHAARPVPVSAVSFSSPMALAEV